MLEPGRRETDEASPAGRIAPLAFGETRLSIVRRNKMRAPIQEWASFSRVA